MLHILKRGGRLVALIILAFLLFSGAAKVAVHGLYDAPIQSQNKGPLFGKPGKEILYIALPSEGDHVVGDVAARAVVIAYLSFGCHECAKYYKTLQKLAQEGVTVVLRHHQPQHEFGSRAFPVAHAAECVAEYVGQERFWEVAEYVFANQDNIFGAPRDPLPPLRAQFGVSDAPFEECMDSNRYAARIEADTQEARSVAKQTPVTAVFDSDKEKVYLLLGNRSEADVQQRLLFIESQ